MITKDQAVAELREIAEARRAAEGRDYIYKSLARTHTGTLTNDCLYVHAELADDGTRIEEPGCIIGVWLHEKHGIPLDTLADHEYEYAAKVIESDGIELDVDPDAVYFLNEVQRLQDGSLGWLAAIDVAIDEALEHGKVRY